MSFDVSDVRCKKKITWQHNSKLPSERIKVITQKCKNQIRIHLFNCPLFYCFTYPCHKYLIVDVIFISLNCISLTFFPIKRILCAVLRETIAMRHDFHNFQHPSMCLVGNLTYFRN